MNYVIVSDIFGLTAPLMNLSGLISSNARVIDPYKGVIQPYDSEQYYYNKFKLECGHDNYVANVLNALNALTQPTTCIAFSAGASAAWRAQLLTGNPHLKKLFGFYPSQIRNNLAIEAKKPCEFIFPESEVHFNLSEIIEKLTAKRNVNCIQTPFLHGFMNEYSENFNAQALNKYCNYIKSV